MRSFAGSPGRTLPDEHRIHLFWMPGAASVLRLCVRALERLKLSDAAQMSAELKPTGDGGVRCSAVLGVCIVCGSRLMLQIWRGHPDNKKIHCNGCGSEIPLWLHKERQCQECGGEGGVDSGGMTPWGSGIMIPCPSCSKTPNTLLEHTCSCGKKHSIVRGVALPVGPTPKEAREKLGKQPKESE